MVQAKALEIAKKLNCESFTASNGWLSRWRKRYNISFKQISGEAASVNEVDVCQFREKLPHLLHGYKPQNIYNLDETGLFFRALPNKTLALKSETCHGGKLSKERLTVLFCVNMAGEKEKPLVIGKAARPRAFSGVNVRDLPVDWYSNKKAWMTRDIMGDWLMKFDKKITKENRKILLFWDNAASHPPNTKLRSIKVINLPPNTTSVCQPLDQGIIQNFKVFYRGLLVKHLLSKIDTNAAPKSNMVNVLDAIYFIKTAWNSVKPETIRNCFSKAGFSEECIGEIDFDEYDDIPLATLSLFLQAKSSSGTSYDNIEHYVDIDKCAFIENPDFEVDIGEDTDTASNEAEESEAESDGESTNKITSYEMALSSVGDLKRFAKEDYGAFELIKKVEMYYQDKLQQRKNQNMRQKNLLDFFKI